MKILKRTLSLVLALALTLTLFAGCGKNSGSDTANQITVDGKTINVPYALIVNGNKVSMDLFRYFYLTMKTNYDGGDETVWDDEELTSQLLEATESYVVSYAIIEALCDEYGITLTEDQQAEADSYKEQFKTMYSDEDGKFDKDAYNEYLESMYLTEGLYERLLKLEYLSENLQHHLYPVEYKDEEVEAKKQDVADNYLKAKHILVEDEATANEVLNKIAEGASFDDLISEYNTDAGMESNPDGYIFTEGDMVDAFYEAATALSVGEISGIVPTDYGYHIIMRVELTDEDVASTAEDLIADAKDSESSEEFTAFLEEQIDSAKIEYSKYYDKFSPKTIK